MANEKEIQGEELARIHLTLTDKGFMANVSGQSDDIMFLFLSTIREHPDLGQLFEKCIEESEVLIGLMDELYSIEKPKDE